MFGLCSLVLRWEVLPRVQVAMFGIDNLVLRWEVLPRVQVAMFGTDCLVNVRCYQPPCMHGMVIIVNANLKEWNMFKIFSCHLIRICFRSDKHPHLDWSI